MVCVIKLFDGMPSILTHPAMTSKPPFIIKIRLKSPFGHPACCSGAPYKTAAQLIIISRHGEYSD